MSGNVPVEQEIAVRWEAFKDSGGFGQVTLDPDAQVGYSAPLVMEPNADALGVAATFILDLSEDGNRLVGIEVQGAPDVYPREVAARWNEANFISATARVARIHQGVRISLSAVPASRSVDVTGDTPHEWLRLEFDGQRLVGLIFLGEEGARRMPANIAKIIGQVYFGTLADRVTPVPTDLGGARVLFAADVREADRSGDGVQMFSDGDPSPEPGFLVVATYDGGSYYLFHCDEEWATFNDLWFATVEEAKAEVALTFPHAELVAVTASAAAPESDDMP